TSSAVGAVATGTELGDDVRVSSSSMRPPTTPAEPAAISAAIATPDVAHRLRLPVGEVPPACGGRGGDGGPAGGTGAPRGGPGSRSGCCGGGNELTPTGLPACGTGRPAPAATLSNFL